jgi:hypothetical protein
MHEHTEFVLLFSDRIISTVYFIFILPKLCHEATIREQKRNHASKGKNIMTQYLNDGFSVSLYETGL